MTSLVVHREAVRDVEVICRRRGDSRELRTLIAGRLRRLVQADAFCFGAVDPSTLLVTDEVSDGIPPGAAEAAVHNEYAVDDVLKFVALARSRVTAGVLSVATDGRPELSHRYRCVLPLVGARHELRAVFVVDGQCWGGIAMFRRGDRPDFTAADAELMGRISAPVGAALRRAAHQPATGTTTGQAEAGVLLLSREFDLLAANPAAEGLLSALATARPAALPIAVLEAGARCTASGLPAHGRVRGATGEWLSVRASPLTGGLPRAVLAVTIDRAPAADVAELLLLAYGLTQREREILRQVLGGLTTRAIARKLEITSVTVQDHLKKIFAKTGARSRGEVTALILGR